MVLKQNEADTLWLCCRTARMLNKLLKEDYFTQEEIKTLDKISEFIYEKAEIFIDELPF